MDKKTKRLLLLIPCLLLTGCGISNIQQESKVLTTDEASLTCANTIWEAITKTQDGKNIQKSDLVFKPQTLECDDDGCIVVGLVNEKNTTSSEVYGCAIVGNKVVQYQTELYSVGTWNNGIQIETVESKPKVSREKQNALGSAQSYVKHSDFSKKSLKEQLEYEGYTSDAIDYALENLDVDYKKECLGEAESYLRSSNFSKKGLMEQLEYVGYTSSEIEYAMNHIDW